MNGIKLVTRRSLVVSVRPEMFEKKVREEYMSPKPKNSMRTEEAEAN
jgi:hypothetical protein